VRLLYSIVKLDGCRGWAHRDIAFIPLCSGEACRIRYADDFVCAFKKEEGARRFYEALAERPGKFWLELSAEKTQMIPFSPKTALGETSFIFLGFEFRWGLDRKGKPHVNKRTARKNLRKSVERFELWIKDNRHRRLPNRFSRSSNTRSITSLPTNRIGCWKPCARFIPTWMKPGKAQLGSLPSAGSLPPVKPPNSGHG
jgi:hypothetical protein